MNNLAEQTLLDQRQKLIHEKEQMIAKFDEQISQLETAIERLLGKKVWEIENLTLYDDTNPDYIKGSIEE